MIWQARSTANGDSSADLTTTAFPATSAGATFSAISIIGTFQGMIAPTTPSGSRIVMVSMSGRNGTVSPFNSEPRPPKKIKTSASTEASIRLSVRSALPVSSATSLANSSTCPLSRRPHSVTSFPRSRAGTFAHAFWARLAACTAASTSAASPCAASPTTAPVAGLTFGNVRPLRAGTIALSISSLPDSSRASANGS